MRNLCLHHNDGDGICSAAIVNKFVDNCDFYPINYGFKVPWNKIKKADVIYMVDFGLQPFSDMCKLLDMKGKKLIWIDHHKTAIDDEKKSGQKFEGIREIGKAGCELTWEYFSDAPMPRIVRMVGRYDVWDLNYSEETLPIHYGMLLKNMSPTDSTWGKLLNDDMLVYANILDRGKICHQYQAMRYDQYCKPFHFLIEWEGLKLIVANAMNVSSGLFDGYFNQHTMDAMMCFGWLGDKWTVSMYTIKKGIDVGAVCKKYGGGGHVGAAGFQCEALPFPMKGDKLTE